MAKGGDEVKIPEYKAPTPTSFSLFGNTASKTGDDWNYSVSGVDQNTLNQAKKIRQDLISSLGVQDTEASKNYQNTMFGELLRTSQPKLENALIGRGLGGSTVYKDALTDLITKAATQSVLGGQQYQANQQGLNLNNLTALQNYLSGETTTGQNLLNLATGYNTNQNQLAQQMYQNILPYKSTVEAGGDLSGAGGLYGTLAGLALAAPTGGMSPLVGALLGNMVGGGAGSLVKF
jgi:hypothetical protein